MCRTIRDRHLATAIIILSAITDTPMKIRAIDEGADDYLTKPFSFAERLVRIRALLRRERQVLPSTLRLADLEFDTNSHTVTRATKAIHLSKKELALLEYFMRHPGITLSRAILLEHVWDMNAGPLPTPSTSTSAHFVRSSMPAEATH